MHFFALNKCLKRMIKEKKSTEVRGKIIKTARDLFIKNGLNGTSIRDIANASGTNVAMVNYYFQSKDNLFEVIFKDTFDLLAERVFSAIDSDLPFFDMIRKWVYSYYDTLMEDPQLPIFILNELSQRKLTFEEQLRMKNPYQVFAKLAIRINEEEQKGTIRKLPVSDFLLNLVSLSIFPFVFGPVATTFLNLSEKEYKELLENHKEYVVDFIINAIKIKD